MRLFAPPSLCRSCGSMGMVVHRMVSGNASLVHVQDDALEIVEHGLNYLLQCFIKDPTNYANAQGDVYVYQVGNVDRESGRWFRPEDVKVRPPSHIIRVASTHLLNTPPSWCLMGGFAPLIITIPTPLILTIDLILVLILCSLCCCPEGRATLRRGLPARLTVGHRGYPTCAVLLSPFLEPGVRVSGGDPAGRGALDP